MLDFTSQPASLTKHLDSLAHPLPRQVSTHANISHPVALQQKSSALSESTGTTGTTLWLGAQLMAAYLAETLAFVQGDRQPRKKVIELGGGVGYLAIVLAAMGYEVTTTDIDPPLTHVLRPNISRNSTRMALTRITASSLDWCAFPSLPCDDDSGLFSHEEAVPDSCRPWHQPWETIVTTDTIYHADLIEPLLKSLRTLSILAASAKRFNPDSTSSNDTSATYPLIYVALENRDPKLVNTALEMAKEYGFIIKRISQSRVDKCLTKSGWSWDRNAKQDYDGIQLWKWRLTNVPKGERREPLLE